MIRNSFSLLPCFAVLMTVAFAVAQSQQDSKKTDDATTLAQAQAKAEAVGKEYETAQAALDKALKEDKLDEAVAAARDMIRLSNEPGKAPWQPAPRTFFNLIKLFEQKKVFAAKHTIALYEEALKKLESADDKAELMLAYGLFIQTYMLVDDKKAAETIESAFSIPGVSVRKQIQMRQKLGELNAWAEFDANAKKALDYAGNDPALRLDINLWMINGFARSERHDEVAPLYEKLLADPAFVANKTRIATEFVRYLNRMKRFKESLSCLERMIAESQGENKIPFLRLLADTHRQAAGRYYSEPDKEDILLATKALRDAMEITPTNKVFEIAELHVQIAEMFNIIGDYPAAMAEADSALATPDIAARHNFLKVKADFILGQAAYSMADYGNAIAIIEPLVKIILEGPINFPQKRDAIEMLIRANCAVGDFQKAYQYSAELMKCLKRHEVSRYEIYFDGLKRRANIKP